VCHPYEVWGLTPNRVIERYNYCNQAFDIIPGSLINLFTGGGEVWGYDAVNQAYRYNASTGSFDVFPGTFLTNITLGPDGVWAEDSSGQALQFNTSTQSFIGTGVTLFGIAAGGDGIWGFSSSGISRMIPSTGQLITIPMNEHAPRSILVGNGSGVWTTSYSQIVYRFVNP
jgi:streptogramin lyase